MAFKWNDTEVKTLIIAYTFVGAVMFAHMGYVSSKTACYYGPDMWEMPSSIPLTYTFTGAGIGALSGFIFVVSILFSFLYLPERLWNWLRNIPS